MKSFEKTTGGRVQEAIAGKRTLVIGGRGFIGTHLVSALLEAGSLVTSLSLSGGAGRSERESVEYLTADLRSPESLGKVLAGRGFDYVINAGGYIDHRLYFSGGRDLIAQHFLGTMNLLDLVAGRDLKGYVQLGSSDEYGPLDPPQGEDMREMPISPYSAAKVASAQLLQMLHRSEGVPAAVVRLFLSYGPGQEGSRFLPQVIKGCLADRVFKTSEGMQLRDFCYVTDVVKAILLAMVVKEAHGRVINVASGRPVSIREVIERVVSLVGGGKPDFGRVPYRIGENMALYADTARAAEILGWRPLVSLDEGLKKTIAWYRNRMGLDGASDA